MENLTSSQRARLEAARANLRAQTRRTPEVEKDFSINRDEYRRRLAESMRADAERVVEQATVIRARSLKEWEDRVGPRWASATTDNEAVIDRVERMKKGEGLHKTSLLAIGKLGVGKSYLAYAYARELISAGVLTSPQIYVATESSVASVVSGGFNAATRLAEILDEKHKFFIFDDIGQAHYSSPVARQGAWHEILDHIYSRRLAMVMTTNLSTEAPTARVIDAEGKPVTKNQLNLWLGDAAFSRLVTIIGNDGIVVPGEKNMRAKVFREWEDQYRSNQ